MTAPDPGRVLRLAIVAWGLGHLALGRAGLGRALLVAEAVALGLVAWLTIGLADSSAYLVPFIAGTAFVVAWAWQAVHAYRTASVRDAVAAPHRSAAAAIGWLSLPLLIWGAGFWVVGAEAATPAAVLDRFVTAWTSDDLDDQWPPEVVGPAAEVAADLNADPEGFRDVRITLISRSASAATAAVEAIRYEPTESRFLWIFPLTELVPVAEARLLVLELAARPIDLPGGGDIGAVEWELVGATPP